MVLVLTRGRLSPVWTVPESRSAWDLRFQRHPRRPNKGHTLEGNRNLASRLIGLLNLADTTISVVIIRPVAMADLNPLLELAGLAGAGLTTLPRDAALLKKRIDKS